MELYFSTSKNKFVYLALQITLALIAEIKGITSLNASLSKGLDIAIVGDNDFYSQREKVGTKLNVELRIEKNILE